MVFIKKPLEEQSKVFDRGWNETEHFSYKLHIVEHVILSVHLNTCRI